MTVKTSSNKLIFVPHHSNLTGFHYTLGAYKQGSLLDAHATKPRPDGSKQYAPIFQIPTAIISNEIDDFATAFNKDGMHLKKLRLGWLRRNNYLVITSKFLPRKWFEIQKNYDFSKDGMKNYEEKISRFKNRMIFDPEILWRLDLDQFSENPLCLANGQTGKYLHYKACDWNGIRYVFAISFRNQEGRKISSQAAFSEAARDLRDKFENLQKKVEEVYTEEKSPIQWSSL